MARHSDPRTGLIDEETLGPILIALAAHARARARNFRWRTGSPLNLPEGQTPEGLAAEAVVRVMAEERRFDPKRGDLLPYLRGVVDSMISHLAGGAENRRVVSLFAATAGADRQGAASPAVRISDDPFESPEDVAIANEQLELLAAVVSGDAELSDLLDLVLQDTAPATIAERLGVSVAEVHNRLKRLRRVALREFERRRPVSFATKTSVRQTSTRSATKRERR